MDPSVKPGPRFSPTETRRIHDEDRPLIKVLEELIPEFDAAYDDLGQPFDVFHEAHMIPRINEVLIILANEDREQFLEGRRALGIVMEHLQDEG